MKNKTERFAINDLNEFKIKMLNWSSQFNIFCFLDNNKYKFDDPAFECILAAGSKRSISPGSDNIFEALKQFSSQNPGWLFGHFGYPDANGAITQKQHNEIDFGAAYFFIPQVLLRLQQNELIIETDESEPAEIFESINKQSGEIKKQFPSVINLTSRISITQYLDSITALKKHIQRGDCYEINFCQDFFSEQAVIDPLFFYQQLTNISPNPFSAFYRLNDKYCMCASPERFLKKEGQKLISQPIKGTSKRNLINKDADDENRNYLLNSAKEKSENVMVVDLVRNDLSRVCTAGSVHVKELFGIYSFPQVHQMISTIEGTVGIDVHWTDIIKATFPMGSMTGAPKIKVMELIERYEKVPRGLFSGSIGYVTPGGDFDFNVVIRSLFYDASKKYISFKVGGGITFKSDPLREYEECMLKAEALIKILGS